MSSLGWLLDLDKLHQSLFSRAEQHSLHLLSEKRRHHWSRGKWSKLRPVVVEKKISKKAKRERREIKQWGLQCWSAVRHGSVGRVGRGVTPSSLTHSHVKTFPSSAVVWWSISVLGKCAAFIYSGEHEIRGNNYRPISIVSTPQIASLNIHYDSAKSNQFFPQQDPFNSDIYTYILQSVITDSWLSNTFDICAFVTCSLSWQESFFQSTLCLHSLTCWWWCIM